MELQFENKPIPYLRSVLRQIQSQELTQEVRLPEGFPDIGRVISSWGQVLLRGKEWRSSGINLTGGVMVWVLYAPEDGTESRCVEAWLPFQSKMDFTSPEQDGIILAYPLLQSVDARSTAARKMMARASVSVLGEAMSPETAAVSMPVELPEDVQLLKHDYPVCLPVEAGEKAFSLEESLQVPDSTAVPAKLIRYDLRPCVTEQRLLSDKLIFRGVAMIRVLYADNDGQLHGFETEVPFSQYAELKQDYSDSAKTAACVSVTNLEMELGSAGDLALKAGLTGQYMVSDCMNIQLSEDAYSPVRTIQMQSELLQLPVVLETRTEQIAVSVPLENAGDQVVDAVCYPEHGRTYYEDGHVVAELNGVFQLLCMDRDGQLYTQSSSWSDSLKIPAASNVESDALVAVVGKSEGSPSGANTQLQLEMRMIGGAGQNMISALELGELKEPDPSRPSLILCRTGEGGLWDVAKQSGSTVDAIMKANGLVQEPEIDRLLLVPVL